MHVKETPEPFPLPTEAPMMKTAAGWAHCVSVTLGCKLGPARLIRAPAQTGPCQAAWVPIKIWARPGHLTETGEVYTWGWEECVPSGKIVCDFSSGGSFEKEPFGKQSSILSEQVSPRFNGSKRTAAAVTQSDNNKPGEESVKQRRISSTKQEVESSTSTDETLSAPPCLVDLDPGVRITSVAAGGRHTLALSDAGALLTFGWGLHGQVSIFMSALNLEIMWARNTNDVLRPPCVSSLLGTQIEGIAAGLWHIICISVEGRLHAFGGNQFSKLGTGTDQSENLPKLLDDPSLENKRAKIISWGARHSAILTEDGRVYCWGWNKYGQLGLGDSIDRNVPSQVPIEGCLPKSLACGWWHTLLLAQIPF
ncbi:hypothetical protein ACSBR2_003164 [Camellia fascicularis]